MNKRDEFAARAMQGILSSVILDNPNGYTVNNGFLHAESLVETAYEIANEMMEQSAKNEHIGT
tara:strand:+ start:5478 stop:5666 length:189 start_codon:yes stop_codon:yes gene_type:complete